MLIYLESNKCVTTTEEMDHFAQKCYQSGNYVTPGREHYLQAQMRYEHQQKGTYNNQTQRFECIGCSKPFPTKFQLSCHIVSPVHDP